MADVPVPSYIDRASERVRAEAEVVEAKRDAFDSLCDRVAALPADRTPSSAGIMATAGVQRHVASSTNDGCRQVRTAFAETIRPHSVSDVDDPESLLETIREELTDTIAVALAPSTDTPFTPDLKRIVVAKAQSRRAEAAALREALDRETAHLDDAEAVVDDVTAWIAETDETPLTDLGFDALSARHETLTGHRDRCGDLLRQRQGFLRETTNNGAEAGVGHADLIPYLYQDFPVDHPVLATVARLDSVCADCQRAVRAHLVRRA